MRIRGWETEGRGQLDTLLELLDISHEVIDMGGGRTIYVWPSAYVYESWNEVPTESVAELGAIHIQEEIESFDTRTSTSSGERQSTQRVVGSTSSPAIESEHHESWAPDVGEQTP